MTAKRQRSARAEQNDGSQGAESDDPDAAGATELWDRARPALVIAGLAASCGAVAAVAVVLLMVDIEWLGSGQSLFVYTRVDGVRFGLAGLVPAVTTVLIFRHVRDVWRELIYADKPADAPVEVPR